MVLVINMMIVRGYLFYKQDPYYLHNILIS